MSAASGFGGQNSHSCKERLRQQSASFGTRILVHAIRRSGGFHADKVNPNVI